MGLLVAVGALLALGAASASAEVTHSFVKSFDGSGTPSGSFVPASVAVDLSGGSSAGDVYVSSGQPIDKFSGMPSVSYLCQITGAGSSTTSPSECDASSPGAPNPSNSSTAAVDPATGDVWIAKGVAGELDKFSSAGAYESHVTGLQIPNAPAFDVASGVLYIPEEGTGDVKRFDPATSSLTTFATLPTPNGLAVDNSGGPSTGDVYVAAAGAVRKFDSAGHLLSTLRGTPAGSFGFVEAVAVDPATGDLYVSDHAGFVDQFDPVGKFLGQLTGAPTPSSPWQPAGLAVDASGDLYVGDLLNGIVDVFGPGYVVPDVTTGSASNLGPTSATVSGTVNPDSIQLTGCHFDYGTSTAYGQSAACVPAAGSIPPDANGHPVTANLSGLTPGVTYHFRLVAANANGSNAGTDATFFTPPPPSIDTATATNVTASTADLNAQINPNGYDTTYHLQYGTTTGYGTTVPVPDADLGSSTTDVPVTQHITGLSPNTEYHWRIVATNTNGTVGTTIDHTFVYDTSGGGLPDGRVYELVSPPQRNGALLGVSAFGLPPSVSADGSRVVTGAVQCFADATSCNAQNALIGSFYVFNRSSAGWEASAATPPASPFYTEPRAVFADTGMSFYDVATASGIFDWYSRSPDGTVREIGPLSAPGFPVGGGSPGIGPTATPDLGHLVWTSDDASWPFDPSTGHTIGGLTVYEYSGVGNSQPLLVGVSGGPGSTSVVSPCGTRLGALASDGATIYFTSIGANNGACGGHNSPLPADQLYARVDNDGPSAHTVLISGKSRADCTTGPCQSSAPGDARFEGASRDGSRAYFTSTQQLTDDATQDSQSGDGSVVQGGANGRSAGGCNATTGPNGCNLYLYDFSRPSGHELRDASAGDSSGGGPQVQGVVAVSADGSHVYFVAKGVLAANADANGGTARAGQNNLYVYDAGSGTRSFIAALPQTDSDNWLTGTVANVTPDGRFLVFVSHGDLTPDDTSRSGANQVFRFDANTGQLIRISIGELGFNDNGNRAAPAACDSGGGCAENAAIAPRGLGTDPTMSADGSYVFFTSPVALTPRALDDVQISTDQFGGPIYANNVYEWHDGHVSLISDGRDTSANTGTPLPCTTGGNQGDSSVCLLGTDTTGRDVFFSTADQLVSQDTNTALDYYDARIGGGFPNAPAPIPCQGDGCQGTPSGQPTAPMAATVSFVGPGDPGPAGKATTGRVTAVRHAVRGLVFWVRVRVPGKGRITITGAGIQTAGGSMPQAGTYSVRVRLTGGAKRRLKHKHKLKLTLHVGFAAAMGAASHVTFSITDKP